jgi:gamma-D-glutamyl-L-lysine dipeptidyl-peptidase
MASSNKQIFMKYAFVSVPAAPVRLKPRHQREMVTQLLFGEAVEVLKEKGNLWVKIRSLHDEYEGWITRTLLTEADKNEVQQPVTHITSGLLNKIQLANDTSMHVPLGASLREFSNGTGCMGQLAYRIDNNTKDRTTEKPSGELIESLTKQWLNAPYCWGGRTIYGVDCSGFVQVNFKLMGIDLPRDAWQQAQEGEPVDKLKNATTGDLAFFDDKEEIVHVGILLGNDKIIHASGNVRIDTIDKKGIIHSATGKRTHQLESLRRYW